MNTPMGTMGWSDAGMAARPCRIRLALLGVLAVLAPALAMPALHRSIHSPAGSLHRPLITSRASRPPHPAAATAVTITGRITGTITARTAAAGPVTGAVITAHSLPRDSRNPGFMTRAPEMSLLNDVAQLRRNVSGPERSAWLRESRVAHGSRAAALAVWLGDLRLARDEEPADALDYFKRARQATPRKDAWYGLAVYDSALVLSSEGRFAESAQAFRQLLSPRTALLGYSHRECALWYRREAMCAQYHADRAKLGIPEPSRLDPECGAAALAACLRAHGLPYDRKTVLRACKVTGEGSSLADIIEGGRKLGLVVRAVGVDDAGLRALPKPCVVHIEGDHFGSVIRANAREVVYLCSDCGAWPGGEIHLTWTQWHAMNPDAYGVATVKGTSTDRAMASAVSGKPATLAPVRVAARGSLAGLGIPHLMALSAILKGHVVTWINPWQVYCELPATTVRCTGFLPCPSDNSPNCQNGLPVDLATGEENYQPGPDLVVYNPQGPPVLWGRSYATLRGQTEAGYESNDFGVGWSQNYNVAVYDPTNGSIGDYPHFLVLANGARVPFDVYSRPTAAQPRVIAQVLIQAPIQVEWDYSASDTAGFYTITFKDRSQWITTLENHTSSCYSLGTMLDRNGRGLSFSYGAAVGGWPVLQAISDLSTGTPLLEIQRATDGTSNITSVTDVYGRSVFYHCGTYPVTQSNGWHGYFQELETVSQAGSGPSPAANRWTYAYQNYQNTNGVGVVTQEPFLHTLSTPSPTGTGTSTKTINYATNTNYVTSETDANGDTRSYLALDGTHTQVTVTDAQSTKIRGYICGFDNYMRRQSLTDDRGVVVSLSTYNDPNDKYQPDTQVDGNGNVTYHTWDRYGNMTSETSPRGVVTVNTIDYSQFALGELLLVQQGNLSPTGFTYYEPSGLVRSVTGPAPGSNSSGATVSSSFTYDSLGNVLTSTVPGNDSTTSITSTFNYSTDGAFSQAPAVAEPLTVTDNLGAVSHFRYDPKGLVLSSTDSLGNESDMTYNVVGQALTVSAPATGQTGTGRAYTQDSYLYPGGERLTVKAYDESGVQVRQVNYNLGPEDELLSVTGGVEPVAYTYDGDYRLTAISDGNLHSTLYHYDSAGYLDKVTYPGGEYAQFPLHDGNGNVLKRLDCNGAETDYLYNDPESLLTDEQYPASTSLNVHHAYDIYGREVTRTDGTGTSKTAYDDRDDVTGVQTTYTGLAYTVAVGYSYYPNGSRQQMSTPAGTYSYGYDLDGRMTSLTNPCNRTAGWSYLDNGWLSTQSIGNGAVTTYTRNARGILTDLTTRNGLGTILSEFNGTGGAMQYDAPGNVLASSANVPGYSAATGSNSYQYDSANELTQEQSGRGAGYTNTFGYDSAFNPTTFKGSTQSFNANNQNTAFTFNSNGDPTTYQGSTLTYDPEDRLTAYGTVMTAGYTGDGLRAWKQTAAGKTYFIYDGQTPVCELNSSGVVTAFNTFGPNGLIGRNNSAGSTLYTFDPQGSVCERLDHSGSVISTSQFDSFGNAIGSASTDPFGYGGQWGYFTDSDTGLILLTHRYYDPAQGRFLTRDPIGYLGGINLYGYTANSPMNAADPDGLSVDSVRASVAAAVAVGGTRGQQALEQIIEDLGPLREGSWSQQYMFQPVYQAVSRIMPSILSKRGPPSSFTCNEVAEDLRQALIERGIPNIQIYFRLPVNAAMQIQRTGLQRLNPFWRGETFTLNGYHTATWVQGRVFDSITGPAGLTVSQWLQRTGYQASNEWIEPGWPTLPH